MTPRQPGFCGEDLSEGILPPNVGAKGDSSGVTPGPEDRKCTPYLASGPGGTPLLLPLERLVRQQPFGTRLLAQTVALPQTCEVL
jgi:hypothetical protein